MDKWEKEAEIDRVIRKREMALWRRLLHRFPPYTAEEEKMTFSELAESFNNCFGNKKRQHGSVCVSWETMDSFNDAIRAELDRQREARKDIEQRLEWARHHKEMRKKAGADGYEFELQARAYSYCLGLSSVEAEADKPTPTYEHDPHFWRRK